MDPDLNARLAAPIKAIGQFTKGLVQIPTKHNDGSHVALVGADARETGFRE